MSYRQYREAHMLHDSVQTNMILIPGIKEKDWL